MARSRSPDRDKAKELYITKPTRTLKSIAGELGISEGTVRGWKNKDKWDSGTERKKRNVPNNNTERSKQKEPKKKSGNPNPVIQEKTKFRNGNKAATKHDLYSKFLHAEQIEIIEAMEGFDMLDQLWLQIQISFASILRAQKNMWVENKDDHLKVIKKSRPTALGKDVEYEVSFAHERYESYIKAQSRAMDVYRVQVEKFIKLAPPDDPRLSQVKDEERNLKLDKLRAEIGKIEGPKAGTGLQEYKNVLAERFANRKAAEDK